MILGQTWPIPFGIFPIDIDNCRFEFLEGDKECISSCSDVNSEKEWTWSSMSLSDSSIAKAEQLSIVSVDGDNMLSTSFYRDITIIVCVLQSIPILEVKKLKWRDVTRLSYELVRCETHSNCWCSTAYEYQKKSELQTK